MRIGVISTPHEDTPPRRYGGVERVIGYLVRGLTKRGFAVTLFATGSSSVACDLRYAVKKPVRPYSEEIEMHHVKFALEESSKLGLDIIHNHCNGLSSLALLNDWRGPPAVSTLHGLLSYERVARLGIPEKQQFIAISKRQMMLHDFLNFVGVIHHGIEANDYPFRRDKDDYLLFIGLISPHKGPHVAVRAARELGAKLILAGKLETNNLDYFDREIEPFLSDRIIYVGEVDEEMKRELMAGAKCLLFTSLHEEPFGVVMLEAMACGTPVIALANGAAPEVVKHGVTGYIVNDLEGMKRAIERVEELKPEDCRKHIEGPFSAERMVEDHVSLYKLLFKEAEIKLVAPQQKAQRT